MSAEITAYATGAAPATAVGRAPNAANTLGRGQGTAGASVGAEEARQLKLKKAARQFEAMLLAKWWSSMRKSGLGDEDESDAGAGTLEAMGMQAMSTAIAGAGGIGIATMLVHSLQGEIATQHAARGPAGSAANAPGAERKPN